MDELLSDEELDSLLEGCWEDGLISEAELDVRLGISLAAFLDADYADRDRGEG